MDDKVKGYILDGLSRQITSFYKNNLKLLEEMSFEHSQMLKKLSEQIPLSEINKIDYFDENRYNLYRKRILDMGNDLIRELESNFEKVDLTLKPLTLNGIPVKKISVKGTIDGKTKVKGKLI
jgi:hypothetical protein